MVNKLSLTLAFAFFATPAFCATPPSVNYVNLTPPPGHFIIKTPSGIFVARVPVTPTSVVGGHAMTSATLNLGARSVSVPVAMRVVANVGAFAVTRLNPYLTGVQLALAAYPYLRDWFNSTNSNLAVDENGVISVTAGNPAEYINPDGTYQYHPDIVFTNGQTMAQIVPEYHRSLCDFYVGTAISGDNSCSAYLIGKFKVKFDPQLWKNVPSCASDAQFMSYVTVSCFPKSGGLVNFAPQTIKPATEADIAPLAQTAINPRLIPYISPDIEVEVMPVINPATQPVGEPLITPAVNPAPALQSAPFRVPNGEPIPIPNSQQYEQPWYEVTPAPTPDQPWRVQVISVTTVIESPVEVRKPEPVPLAPTDCDKFPDSLGCMSVDVPEDDEIPEEEREITLQSGPSFSAGASCPPDLVINFQGHAFSIPAMATACNWIGMARPVILLLAALTALAIVRPGGGPKKC